MGLHFVDSSSASTVVTPAYDVPIPDPEVLSTTPGVLAYLPFSAIDFHFNEAMNPTSFSVAADVVSFTGPGSVNFLPAITGFSWVDTKTLRINFKTSYTPGTYSNRSSGQTSWPRTMAMRWTPIAMASLASRSWIGLP